MSGNLWMFSDMLDDEDIEILKHEFITYYQGADYYGLGLKVFTRMAHEAGAVYKIGKKVLIRRTIFDEYLRQVYQKKVEDEKENASGEENKMKRGVLVVDNESGRMDIRFGMEEYYGGLHCGECMDVLVGSNTFLENLIQSNAQAMEEIRETPYQPIFYAVPKAWLESWMKLLEQAVEFQPTLYQKISLLTTRQELEQMHAQEWQILLAEKQEALKQVRQTLQQDGSVREKFSSDTSKLLSENLRAMEDTAQRLEQRILKRVAWTSILSALLSALACGVLLHLVL